MKPTVLIVDDHPTFRHFARQLLEADGFVVVGEAGDAASAIASTRLLLPQLVLLDVLLPDADGFAVAEVLANEPRPPLIVLTSSRDASDFARRLETTGVRGFLPKGELTGPALMAVASQ
jgi:DNA-binding NarL/FixJ family response regulator